MGVFPFPLVGVAVGGTNVTVGVGDGVVLPTTVGVGVGTKIGPGVIVGSGEGADWKCDHHGKAVGVGVACAAAHTA